MALLLCAAGPACERPFHRLIKGWVHYGIPAMEPALKGQIYSVRLQLKILTSDIVQAKLTAACPSDTHVRSGFPPLRWDTPSHKNISYMFPKLA